MSVEIVIPIYNEEDIIEELCDRLIKVAKSLDYKTFITIIDDGSTDRSNDLIKTYVSKYENFSLIELSRNFGHQPAIAAGLKYSNADAVIVMDGDLQDPPEVIPELIEEWRKGSKVVIAQRISRKETGFRRVCIDVFHRYFNILVDFNIPAKTGTFGLLDKDALNGINKLPETHRFFPGLRAWIGFKQSTVFYDRAERAGGVPKQTYKRLFHLASTAVLSYSLRPLRVMVVAGAVISIASFAISVYFVFKRLLGMKQLLWVSRL